MKIRWAKLKSFMSSFLATLRAKNYLNRPRAGFRGGAVVPAPGLPPTGGLPPNPSIFKTCNSIANPFLKSQIRHWVQASHQGPQAPHQLNPALNRPTFHNAILKIKVAWFFETRCRRGTWSRTQTLANAIYLCCVRQLQHNNSNGKRILQ